MNATTKHDFHPDAESLSAFAEQAMGERERGQVLKHLAVCGRCRQVVALAHEAADAESAPAAVARATIQPGAWWRRWRFAWVPAAALAAMVALTVFVHVRRVEHNAEMAKNERQEITESTATPPAPARQEAQHAPAEAAPPAAPVAAKSPARSAKREAADATHNPPSQEFVAMPAAIPAASGGIDQVEGSREKTASPAAGQEFAAQSPASDRTTAAYTPQPAVTALQQEQRHKAIAGAASRSLYAPRAPATAGVYGTNGGSGENRSEPMISSQPPDVLASAPPSAAPKPSGTLINPDGTTKTIYLPSGLRVESMAAAGPRILAIDTAGALFLSEDSGGTWEHVAPQWTGRAVNVHRQMASGGMKAMPTKFFELLNDQSQIWLSTDGKIWVAK